METVSRTISAMRGNIAWIMLLEGAQRGVGRQGDRRMESTRAGATVSSAEYVDDVNKVFTDASVAPPR